VEGEFKIGSVYERRISSARRISCIKRLGQGRMAGISSPPFSNRERCIYTSLSLQKRGKRWGKEGSTSQSSRPEKEIFLKESLFVKILRKDDVGGREVEEVRKRRWAGPPRGIPGQEISRRTFPGNCGFLLIDRASRSGAGIGGGRLGVPSPGTRRGSQSWSMWREEWGKGFKRRGGGSR